MRALAPVRWHQRLNSWLLTRHAECLRGLKDSRRFAADWRRVGAAVSDHGGLRGPLVSAARRPGPPGRRAHLARPRGAMSVRARPPG